MATSDLLKSLSKSEKLEGEIFVDGKSCGTCRYELTYNPYDTNSMDIVLFGPPSEVTKNYDIDSLEVITDFHWGRYSIKVNTSLASGEFFSFKEIKYSGPVLEFCKIQVFDSDKELERLAFGYRFPLVTVTDSPMLTANHYDVGLVRGKYNKDEDVFIPMRNPFRIKSPVGEVVLQDEFDFHHTRDERYPQIHLIRRSLVTLGYTMDSEDSINGALEKIRNVVYDVFQALSLIERTRVNWHTEEHSGFDSDGNTLFTQTVYKWASPLHDGYRRSHNGIKVYRSTLSAYLESYWDAAEDVQVTLDTIVDGFKVANCCRTLETKFIHWHACLDFFKTHIFKGLPSEDLNRIKNSMSFSMQLIHMLELSETSYKDLLEESVVEQILNAIEGKGKSQDLSFTAIRNQYMHDGFHAFEGHWREASDLTRTMRALAERVVLGIVGIDFKNTSLGNPSLY